LRRCNGRTHGVRPKPDKTEANYGGALQDRWSRPTPDEQLRSKAAGSARTGLNTGNVDPA
jgi:hypothetical protein